MERSLAKLSSLLRLTRVASSFAAVANVWFVILWTRAKDGEPGPADAPDIPGWLALAGGAVTGVGLYAFGAVLNDLLDRRRDRMLRPGRPLAVGDVSAELAVALVAATLLASFLGSMLLGLSAALVCALVACGILFFNIAARHVPSVGLVVLGLLYAGHMVVPNVNLVFVWPVWLAMTHALAVGVATRMLSDARPGLGRSTLLAAGAGWVFWSGVIITLGHLRAGQLWPDFAPLSSMVAPLTLAALFPFLVARKVRLAKSREAAAEKVVRYGALWMAMYSVAWMAGAGLWSEALLLGALAFASFLGMLTLRELYSLAEQPVGYRRA